MQVKDSMTRDVQVIEPDASVFEAAKKMRACGVDCLTVCKGRCCVGLLCGRDIVMGVIAEGRNPKTSRVSDIMTTDLDVLFGKRRHCQSGKTYGR